MKPWAKIATSALLIAAGALAATTVLDQRAETYYGEQFKRALVTFALARALNGAVSVVQGTEIALQPAGVGVTLTPGEIVDPINDLIERFSWVMLAATTSLGMQRLMLEISAWWGLRVLVVAMLALVLLRLWQRRETVSWGLLVRRLALLALFLRFAVPAVFIANTLVYEAFLEDDVVQAQRQIEQTTKEVEAMEEGEDGADTSMVESMRRMLDRTAAAVDVRERVQAMRERLASATEDLINLLAIFVMQTIVFPLLFLWVLMKLVSNFWGSLQPGLIRTEK